MPVEWPGGQVTGNHEFDAFIEAAENNPWFASLTLVERELAIQAFMFAAEIIREEPESDVLTAAQTLETIAAVWRLAIVKGHHASTDAGRIS